MYQGLERRRVERRRVEGRRVSDGGWRRKGGGGCVPEVGLGHLRDGDPHDDAIRPAEEEESSGGARLQLGDAHPVGGRGDVHRRGHLRNDTREPVAMGEQWPWVSSGHG